MRIFVAAKPRAREDGVEQTDQTHFVVACKALPVNGRANQAIIRLLAGHLGVSFARIVLVSGHSTRQKVFEIN